MKRVLVVDDNRDVLQVVQIILQIRGYEVKAIWNAEETITTVQQFSPDVILLDVYLGAYNGIDLCNEIKSNQANKDICVIMFSAQAKSEEILNQCAANAFIEKPFEIKQLADTIESVLSKS